MDKLINAVENSLQNKNWYAALFVALSLPDICGRLENPTSKSLERYVVWFNKYLRNEYTRGIGPFGKKIVTFLSGKDCYALRCAYLHEGRDEITDQRCQQVLNNFRFTTDLSHRNYFNFNNNAILQLNVEIFCNEICTGVKQWLNDVSSDQNIQNKMSKMLKVYDSIF